MKSKLTPKQKMFCKEYLIDLNAAQAAIRAGYSKKTAKEQGHRLLTNVHIADYVQKNMNKRSEKTEITADYVLNGIKKVTEKCDSEENFNPASALKGYELLGKHLVLFSDKVQNQNLDKDGNPADNKVIVEIVRSKADE